jgi:hypothetical protein
MKQKLITEQTLKIVPIEQLLKLYSEFRRIQLRYFLVEYKMVMDELQNRIMRRKK